MLPDVTNTLSWLEQHPQLLTGIGRGIERESLRVQADGSLSAQDHPSSLGSALTHDWIITDFAEALLEFVTPVDRDISHLMIFLRDLHRFTARNIGEERLWPFSIPGQITDQEQIVLAKYGQSNLGQMKHIYRQGLKHRYGSMMQVIAGIHYNFSLSEQFWQGWALRQESGRPLAEVISDGYLRLIRNYYRYGWIIPYLFGASPAINGSFLPGSAALDEMESDGKGSYWFPYATSLRLSDLGYTNKSQGSLAISFNSLPDYLQGLKQAMQTPCADYQRLGLYAEDGSRIQLNTNLLQIENELYAPIRPKRVIRSGEVPSDALSRGGIEYIEVRSLDINPFSATGISEEQVRFLDLFLIWCLSADSPDLSAQQLACTKQNWNRVVMEGRKPGLRLQADCGQTSFSLQEAGQGMFADLARIAKVLDGDEQGAYQLSCQQLSKLVGDPQQTYSARILTSIREQGFVPTGVNLAEHYRQDLIQEPLALLSEQVFAEKAAASLAAQQKIEADNRLSFEEYLTAREG